MQSQHAHYINSIKYSFVFTVILITSSALFVGFLFNGIADNKQKKSELLSQANIYADVIARTTVSKNEVTNSQTTSNKLSLLGVSKKIQNVQIFLVDSKTREKTFYAGYHNSNSLPISLNNKAIANYHKPIFGNESLLFCKNVNLEDKQIAFICLRLSLDSYNQGLVQSFYIKAAALFGSIVIASLLALNLQSKVTKPISQLANLFSYVAREKDYSVRAPKQNVEELDTLGTSFNVMLDRIERHLDDKQKAEAEILQLNQNLENKISQRTDALKDSNKELMDALAQLHEFQNQLVENQKMASLGDMVAGIAHEVNTPIGLGITASTLMIDKLCQVEEALVQKKLTESHLTRFISESKENLDIIYRNLNRSAELITSFKQLAVNQTQEHLQEIKVYSFLQDVLLSLKPSLKNHIVELNCKKDFLLVSKPGILQQILTNLIMNSIIHGFENMSQGTITLEVFTENDETLIKYTDNGKGISEQLKKKIFDPFVTTKRGKGGSGLGMNLVYNLVTQALHGKISVNGELGKGVQLEIRLPIISSEKAV